MVRDCGVNVNPYDFTHGEFAQFTNSPTQGIMEIQEHLSYGEKENDDSENKHHQ